MEDCRKLEDITQIFFQTPMTQKNEQMSLLKPNHYNLIIMQDKKNAILKRRSFNFLFIKKSETWKAYF